MTVEEIKHANFVITAGNSKQFAQFWGHDFFNSDFNLITDS